MLLPLLLAAMIGLAGQSVTARAVLAPRGITVRVSPDTVLVGDRVHCVIDLEHSADERVSIERLDTLSTNQFELVSRKQSASALPSGGGRERFELELAAFGLGRQLLPPFTVVYRASGGQVTGRVPVKPDAAVFVKALTDSTMHELRPIKPPEKPSLPFVLLLPVIIAVSGGAGLVLLVLFLLRRILTASAEKIDPGQVAQRKLRKLGSRLSAGMPPPECYEELSNIMRSFLEKRYRIRALEAVTQEIERDLKKLGVAGFESIMSLLKQADLVKFADSRPDQEESRNSLHKAEEVIRTARTPEV